SSSHGGPFTQCAADRVLPAGLSLRAYDCALVGTLTADDLAGSGVAYVTATNDDGFSSPALLSFTIHDQAVSGLSYANTSAGTGTTVSLSPSYSRLGTHTGFALAGGALPTGLSIDAKTGRISGTVSGTAVAQSYPLQVMAHNADSTVNANFTLTITQ